MFCCLTACCCPGNALTWPLLLAASPSFPATLSTNLPPAAERVMSMADSAGLVKSREPSETAVKAGAATAPDKPLVRATSAAIPAPVAAYEVQGDSLEICCDTS